MTEEPGRSASNVADRVRRLAVLVVTSLVVGAAPADAATATPVCSTVPAGAVVGDPATLPSAIFDAVRRELGDIALPGDPFNPTDVVDPGAKSRRILFVWHKAQRWIVAMERGGRGYSNPVLALDRARTNATVVASRTVLPDRLCETAAALLD